MIDIRHLLSVADAYKRATVLEDVTVSSRAFSDSKKLEALRGGSDITITRFNGALRWFSENWPAGAEWPADVPRPDAQMLEAAQ